MTIKIPIINYLGESCGTYDEFDLLLNEAYRPDILHQVVCWQAMKAKVPNAAKTKGELSYSGKKLYSQRRSGRARRGEFGAPQTRGGGVAFAPRALLRNVKCMKSLRRHALRVALTHLGQNSNFFIVQEFNKIEKTAAMNKFLTHFDVNKYNRALVISSDHHLAARSLHIADTLPVAGLNVKSILRCKKVFVTAECIDEIKRRIRVS